MSQYRFPIEYTEVLPDNTTSINFKPNEIVILPAGKVLNEDGTDSDYVKLEVTLTQRNLNGISTDFNMQYKLINVLKTDLNAVFANQPVDENFKPTPNLTILNQFLEQYSLNIPE